MTTSVLDWVRSFNCTSPNGPLAGNFTIIHFPDAPKKNTLDNYLGDLSNKLDIQQKEFSFEEVESVAKFWRNKNLK